MSLYVSVFTLRLYLFMNYYTFFGGVAAAAAMLLEIYSPEM